MSSRMDVNWGAFRDGAFMTLPRFDSLPHGGVDLLKSYQSVLDRNETFTQFFSDQRLEGYGVEAKLREQLGVGPPVVNDPQNPSSEDNLQISWVNIFRHATFEAQENDTFLCHTQGKQVEIQEPLHRSILLTRCLFPPKSQEWPTPSDVEREAEISLAIEGDVYREMEVIFKYAEGLKKLQMSLRNRRNKLSNTQEPLDTEDPRGLPFNQPTSDPAGAMGSHTTRTRSDSESSGLSSGDDVPFKDADKEPIIIEIADSQSEGPSSTKGLEEPPKIANQTRRTPKIEPTRPSSFTSVNPNFTRLRPHNTPSSTPPVLPKSNGQLTISSKDISTPKSRTSPKRSFQTQSEDAIQPSSKRHKSANATPSAENLRHGKEMALWNIRDETPKAATPAGSKTTDNATLPGTPSTDGKRTRKPETKKRERNNFTEYEKEHAPTFLRNLITNGKTPTEIETDYHARFGVHHHCNTLKLWLGRMDKKENDAKKSTKQPTKQPNKQPSTPGPSTAPATAPVPAPVSAPVSAPVPVPDRKMVVLKPTPISSSMSPHPEKKKEAIPPSYSSPYPQKPRVSEAPRAPSVNHPQKPGTSDTPKKNGLPNI